MTRGHGQVVWMPTFDSEHVHRVSAPNPLHVPISRDGELLPEVLEVLDVIAEHELSLATGHSSPAESLLLIAAAKERGIERIIVTHPLSAPVAMDVETQRRAAEMGALLEYPYQHTLAPGPLSPGGFVPMQDFLAAIRAVGPENVVASSDLGQPGNPIHADGMRMFVQALETGGFSAAEVEMMTQTNPARFLGLE